MQKVTANAPNDKMDKLIYPISTRSIAACILLTIITFGIYGIYWYYLLVKNIRAITEDDRGCWKEMLCLVLVPFYSVYWWYTRGAILKECFAERDCLAKGNSIVYLILSLLGLDIVSMAIMQDDFNLLVAENNRLGQRKSISYDKYGYLFVAPFVIVFLVFQLYPIFFTFRTSLTDAATWAKVLDNKIIGFDNFAKLFAFGTEVSDFFWKSIGNTVIMWLFNFVPQISMALILASWFTDSRMRLKFQGGFKVLIFMPNIITAATIGILFMALMGYPVGPINTLLQQFGLQNAPFEFMRNVSMARGTVSFIQWWMWYGNTMIIMIAGILGINPALFEAALVDGCSSRQTFWKITLPLIKPILLYNLVTSLVGGLTMFDIPHLMTQGAPDYTTNTVARFIYQQGFEAPNNFNIASAASVVLFGIIVICSLILSALMKDRDAKPHKIK